MTTKPQDNLVSATWSKAIEPPGQCPTSADVVIIGGGIIGVSTAWFLAQDGVNVVLCEKGHIAGEQSSRNWGWIRKQGRDVRELPIMIESHRIWRSFEEETGEDIGYAEGGCYFLAATKKNVEKYESWMSTAREFELDTRVVHGDELANHIENTSQKWPGALYTASDGRAEPHKAASAIARVASRLGATILTGCAVRGLETEAGSVSAVVTEHGTIKTSAVLCAAGAWSSMFCRSLGISLPQLKVNGTVARTAPGPKILNGQCFDKRVAIRRRQDGGYTVAHGGGALLHPITPSTLRFAFKFLPALKQEFGAMGLTINGDFFAELATPVRWALDRESPFEKQRVLNPAPSRRTLRRIRKNLNEVFPALANSDFVESWAGTIETTPDVVPVIGPEDRLPGFFIATGLSGHGFGIGPGVGKVAAGLLTGKDSGIDIRPFRLSRFFDGSPIQMGPAL
jgi:glycine/D-amino acid oxidase-like deaminating enzyme